MKRLLILATLLVAVAPLVAEAQCPPGALWCSGIYEYDGAGNIRKIGADTFVYDSVSRLVSGSAEGTTQTYTYDVHGNRIWVATSGPTPCVGPCDLQRTSSSTTNRVVGATYDIAGNLTAITDVVGSTTYSATYSYDAAGMMTVASATSQVTGQSAVTDLRQFLYTADDERLATKNGTSWIWTVRGLDNQILREFSSGEQQDGLPTANRQWLKDYIYRDGALLASKDAQTGTTLHLHTDHLGTPRVITNDAGAVVSRHSYLPFGTELALTPPDPVAEMAKFTGHERDQLANNPHTLDAMHARYHMASVGRFLSVDPSQDDLDLSRPQTWNKYAYVQNNPINKIDPNGRAALLVTAGAGALENAGFQIAINFASGRPWSEGVVREMGIGAAVGATGYGLAVLADKGIDAYRAARAANLSAESIEKGREGVRMSEAAAVARGEVVRGHEVTVKTASGTRMRADLVTETSSGKVKIIEAKNGPNARLTPNQRTALPEIQQTGCTPCGNNARKAGLKPGERIKDVEVQIDRHNPR